MRRHCSISSLDILDRSTTVDIVYSKSLNGERGTPNPITSLYMNFRTLVQFRIFNFEWFPECGFVQSKDWTNPHSGNHSKSDIGDWTIHSFTYAQISASVGTFLSLMTLPIRDTFIRC